jgi:hypothetical protein
MGWYVEQADQRERERETTGGLLRIERCLAMVSSVVE